MSAAIQVSNSVYHVDTEDYPVESNLGLHIIETLMESETQLIANKTAWADAWKRQKIENISLMLNAAIAAQGRVGLLMNVRKADLPAVLKILPALQTPTISSLSDPEWKLCRWDDTSGTPKPPFWDCAGSSLKRRITSGC